MTNGTEPPRTSLHVFPDLEALSRAAAQHIVSHIDRVLSDRERYTLALAGGSTPRRLYELLADVYSGTLPWNRVHLFWGDERCVPHDHPQSNYRLARQTLLEPIDIPPENVHPIPAEGDPAERARTYAETLAEFFDTPTRTFDAALLGMGADGHTASVFPPVETDPSDPDASDASWVRVVEAPDAEISTRISCTLPVLSGASQALFLVSGAHKREALSRVLDNEDPSLPAARVTPRTQRSWFVDTAARPQNSAGA